MFSILPPTARRVEYNTCDKDNERIRRETLENISDCIESGKVIQNRLNKLGREWDVERFVESIAAIIIFISTLFGAKRSKYWHIVSIFVSVFLLQHALQGWCPLLPLLRKMGIRTENEIFNEKTALKIHRGDFSLAFADSESLLEVAEE